MYYITCSFQARRPWRDLAAQRHQLQYRRVRKWHYSIAVWWSLVWWQREFIFSEQTETRDSRPNLCNSKNFYDMLLYTTRAAHTPHTNALNSVSVCFLTLFPQKPYIFFLPQLFLMISHANETWHTFYFKTHVLHSCVVADINFCTQWPPFSDLLQGVVGSTRAGSCASVLEA